MEGHGGGEKGRERQPVGPLEITMYCLNFALLSPRFPQSCEQEAWLSIPLVTSGVFLQPSPRWLHFIEAQ